MNFNFDSNESQLRPSTENIPQHGSTLASTIWSDLRTAAEITCPVAVAAASATDFATRKIIDVVRDFENGEMPNIIPAAFPFEHKLTPQQEAHKMEDLYRDTLTHDEKMRTEALSALRTEGKKLGQDPALKTEVISELSHDLGSAVGVERDANGNPQALKFRSLKEFEDEAKMRSAMKSHNQSAIDAAKGELIKDGIVGGEDVPILSPGQHRVTYLR